MFSYPPVKIKFQRNMTDLFSEKQEAFYFMETTRNIYDNEDREATTTAYRSLFTLMALISSGTRFTNASTKTG